MRSYWQGSATTVVDLCTVIYIELDDCLDTSLHSLEEPMHPMQDINVYIMHDQHDPYVMHKFRCAVPADYLQIANELIENLGQLKR